jgi:hypothetical protein
MRTKLVVAAIATAATVSAVGASAYTASIANVDATKVIGYGATTITGASFAAPGPAYTYNTDQSKLTQIVVSLTGDTHASTLSVSRNAATPVACATGVYDGTTATSYTCSSLNFDVAGMTSLGYSLQ